ncbi:MAG: hypothetical protein Q8N31_25190 [Reyranella sp.]|nr:hypothetical protein [Reyranella sp.]MDP3163321.1 hypothetical protein [Reyranella sp.]
MAAHLLTAIELLRWPAVVFALGIVVIMAFRVPLAGVMGRLTRVKAPGIEAEASEQAQAQTDAQSKRAQELPSPSDLAAATTSNDQLVNPLILEVAQHIARDPIITGVPQGDTRDTVFARHLASVQIALFFERIYQYIFGSQIKALRLANRNFGATISELRAVYDTADHNPIYTFDSFVNYLREHAEFITIDGDNVLITERGREFLKYLVQMRYSDKTWV